MQGVVSVNPFGSTASAVFRQSPTDLPLLTISTMPSPVGSIQYLPAVPNYPYLPPDFDEDSSPIVLTLFPIAISITPLGAALLIYPFAFWEMDLTWPDTSAFPFVAGFVTVQAT